jgi:hypothetical protein
MKLKIIGEHPWSRDEQGHLTSHIATYFARTHVLVTLPGIHAEQRVAYFDWLNQQRKAEGGASLTSEEEEAECAQSVDLIIEKDHILIRPDPENMAVTFAADEALQELVSKRQIKFLQVTNEKVRQAIKAQGECWRISSLPRSVEEMKKMIRESRLPIGGRAIYYYNKLTGTRFLTYHEFAQLEKLEPWALAQHLQEIRDYSGRNNRLNNPQVDFFQADASFGQADFARCQFLNAESSQVALQYEVLKAKFQNAVSSELREDNLENSEWRKAMFSCLIGEKNETLSEEILRGLSPEYFLQLEWLPGGRIEAGELLFDTVFEELESRPDDPQCAALYDEKVKGFIFNFVREYGDVEYVNIGRVASSLSQRPKLPGRRDVYIAEIKPRDAPNAVVRIIRMQKWGIREHLDENKDLLQAILESEEYTEYILNRRFGCRQLGMNLPNRLAMFRVSEKYNGPRREYAGQLIGATYFERDYTIGIATDKIARARYEDAEFALRFARLLGKAAAPNIIVGRLTLEGRVVFDDGDEVVVADSEGLPVDIIVTDLTGAFVSFEDSLERYAQAYAQPVNSRLGQVPDPRAFAAAYLTAFVHRFQHIREEYRKRRRAFDTLFKHCKRDIRGSFAYRWERALERLDRTDAQLLGEQIKAHFAL